MSMYEDVLQDFNIVKVDFRINDLDETMEIKFHGQGWRLMNDTDEAILTIEMMELGYGGKNKPAVSTMLKCATKLANSQRYNPIVDYFEALDTKKYKPKTPKGQTTAQPHVIKRFTEKYFTNSDGWFGVWLFKWMVGSIAKVYEGERNPMLVMGGTQGIGKSFFCDWICPVENMFVKGPINPDNKDNKMRLNTAFVWEVEELGATTRRADVEALKGFITMPFTFERPVYKRHPIKKSAVCSFIGTVNPDGAGFLNDPTGSTRYLVSEIEKIDFGYSDTDPNKLWIEAKWFYDNSFKAWTLSPEQERARRALNGKFEITSALEDAILSVCEITRVKEDFMTTAQIKDELALANYKINNEQAFFNELGRVAKALGIEKGRGSNEDGRPRGWIGISKRREI